MQLLDCNGNLVLFFICLVAEKTLEEGMNFCISFDCFIVHHFLFSFFISL